MYKTQADIYPTSVTICEFVGYLYTLMNLHKLEDQKMNVNKIFNNKKD